MNPFKSMAATHIDDCEGASAATNGTDATAIAIDPDLLMAVAQRKPDVNDDSEDESEDVVSADKEEVANKADLERKLGRRAFKKEDYNEAVAHFQRAINLNPNEIAYHYHLAKTMCEQKKYEECLEICSNAIKVGKENKGSVKLVAASMVLKGQVMKEQEDVDRAWAHVEKAYRFLSSIALVKMEKGKYYEAFDFIHEAFKYHIKIFSNREGEMPKKVEIHRSKRLAFIFKLYVTHLNDTIEWDKEDVKQYEDFIQTKHSGDEAFRKNDHKLAYSIYTKVGFNYYTETIDFIIKLSKEAEENKKWALCVEICCHGTYFLTAILTVSKNKKLKQKWKKILSEVTCLQAKALRRERNFTEALDDLFLEKLKTHKVSRHHLDMYHVKRADDFVNPDINFPTLSNIEWSLCLGMADFTGRGKVTAKEMDVFCKCFLAIK